MIPPHEVAMIPPHEVGPTRVLKRAGLPDDLIENVLAIRRLGLDFCVRRPTPTTLYITMERRARSKPVPRELSKGWQRTKQGYARVLELSAAKARSSRLRTAGLPPSFPIDCGAKYKGRVLPGKRGGTIQGCATPSKRTPHEGNYWVGSALHPAKGHAVRKRLVSQRFYDAKRKHLRVQDDPLFLHQVVEDYDRNPYHLPGPFGQELPYLPGTCRACADHPVWGREYQAAYDDALRAPSEEAAYERFLAHPRAAEWAAIERRAIERYKARTAGRKRVAGFSHQREAARYRAEAEAAGMDTGTHSAEYRDEQKRRRTRS